MVHDWSASRALLTIGYHTDEDEGAEREKTNRVVKAFQRIRNSIAISVLSAAGVEWSVSGGVE